MPQEIEFKLQEVDLDKSSRTFERIERLRQLNSNKAWINDDLYRLMYREDLYIIAYERIKSKPGNLTPGTDGATLDGFSLEKIQMIICEMRSEQFQFKPVRTVYIPKPNGKMRKLGIPTIRDKMVQEVTRMILEAIYDSPYGPYFDDKSHGFRSGRSCHTALREIRGKWAAVNWYVEGDIEKCFDTIDFHVLIRLLQKKISDTRFINLIWKLLRAGYMDMNKERQDSLAGTPQGGIASPILANIYLHELDNKVEEMRQRLEQGKKKRRNRLHRKLSAQRQMLQNTNQTNTREYRELVKQIQSLPAVEVNDPHFIRIKYIRYADDWAVGLCGPYRLAEQIKDELSEFLHTHLRLHLSQDKTRITNARSEEATFLGTRITIGRGGEQRVVLVRSTTARASLRRTTGWETKLNAPIDQLIAKLCRRGFCTALGEPVTKLGWIYLDPEQIISLFNGMNRGIQNYYRFADNFHKISRIQYILQFSLAKTLAAKYKISVKQVFARFGADITVIVKAQDGKKDRTVSFYLNHDWKKDRDAFSTNNAKIDLVQTATAMHTRSKLGKPCCIGGATEDIEMHHVRHIRKMSAKKATGFQAVMQALNRKQIPVCKQCHQKIHRGDYDGMSLSDLEYVPR